MQFFETGHNPTEGALLVGRNTRWVVPILAGLFWSFFGIICFVEFRDSWRDPPLVLWLVGIACLLVTLLAVKDWLLKSRPDNWMITMHREGLWINLRDVSFHAAEKGETVVFLPYREITAVREHVHRYESRSEGSKVTNTNRYLEVLSHPENTKQIKAAIAKDRERKTPGRDHLGGIKTLPGTVRRQPVSVPFDGVIRITAVATNYGMQPKLSRILQRIGEYVRVAEPTREDSGDPTKMDNETFDALIRGMVFRGSTMEATKMLVEYRGMSRTDAKLKMDEISALSEPN